MSNQTQGEQRRSRRSARKIAEERAAKRRRQMISVVGGLVVVAVAIVVALIVVNRPGGEGSNLPPITVAPPLDPSIPVDDKAQAMGDPNAPLKLVEWGDFQ